jgi:hypothetical protein
MCNKKRITIPKYPLLFLKVYLLSLFVLLLLRIVNPINLIKRFRNNSAKSIDAEKIDKTLIYANFIFKLWPWRRLKNYCLIRSVILFYLLGSLGLNPRISFGAKTNSDSLSGHAWITLNNKVYPDDDAVHSGFKTIYSWPNNL